MVLSYLEYTLKWQFTNKDKLSPTPNRNKIHQLPSPEPRLESKTQVYNDKEGNRVHQLQTNRRRANRIEILDK